MVVPVLFEPITMRSQFSVQVVFLSENVSSRVSGFLRERSVRSSRRKVTSLHVHRGMQSGTNACSIVRSMASTCFMSLSGAMLYVSSSCGSRATFVRPSVHCCWSRRGLGASCVRRASLSILHLYGLVYHVGYDADKRGAYASKTQDFILPCTATAVAKRCDVSNAVGLYATSFDGPLAGSCLMDVEAVPNRGGDGGGSGGIHAVRLDGSGRVGDGGLNRKPFAGHSVSGQEQTIAVFPSSVLR